MLNHTKGESHTLDKMTLKENEKYMVHKIYSNKDSRNQKAEDSSEYISIMHKQFETIGEYKFGKLDLMRFGWRRIQPICDEEDEIVTVIEKDGTKINESKILPSKKYNPQKTLVYSNEKAVIVMSINRESNYHEIDISLKNYSDINPQIIEETKRMLENALECKLNEKKRGLSLINKIESN